MIDLLCLGEILIDFVPTARGKRLRDVSTFKKAPGGAPANVAVGFSKLGGSAALISKTGQDEFGFFLRETLNKAAVNTSYLYSTTETLTGLAFVSLQEAGEPEFIFYRRPAADMLLHPDEITESMFSQARIFHYGSVSLIAEPARGATLKAARLAAERGLLVSYDPNLRPALWPDMKQAREEILDAIKWANIMKASRCEVTFLTELTGEKAAVSLFKRYPRLKLIAITAGEEGATLYLRQKSISIPPVSVKAIDPTGAGDGFTAALLYQVNRCTRDKSRVQDTLWDAPDDFWHTVGRFACAAGALVTTRRGGIPAMPDLDSVQKKCGPLRAL